MRGSGYSELMVLRVVGDNSAVSILSNLDSVQRLTYHLYKNCQNKPQIHYLMYNKHFMMFRNKSHPEYYKLSLPFQ